MRPNRTCKHPFEPYDIRQSDQPLIEAAINLGNWLQVQPDFPQSNQVDLKLLLDVLRNLPNPPPPDLCGSFGFEVDSIVEPGRSHYGAWKVDFCRSMFEIFSVKSEEDEDEELSWELCPGTINLNSLNNSTLWISEVSSPRALVSDGLQIAFEATAITVSS